MHIEIINYIFINRGHIYKKEIVKVFILKNNFKLLYKLDIKNKNTLFCNLIKISIKNNYLKMKLEIYNKLIQKYCYIISR